MADLKRYDLFGWDYAAINPMSEQEIAWHIDWARRTGGPALGLACGTGLFHQGFGGRTRTVLIADPAVLPALLGDADDVADGQAVLRWFLAGPGSWISMLSFVKTRRR